MMTPLGNKIKSQRHFKVDGPTIRDVLIKKDSLEVSFELQCDVHCPVSGIYVVSSTNHAGNKEIESSICGFVLQFTNIIVKWK